MRIQAQIQNRFNCGQIPVVCKVGSRFRQGADIHRWEHTQLRDLNTVLDRFGAGMGTSFEEPWAKIEQRMTTSIAKVTIPRFKGRPLIILPAKLKLLVASFRKNNSTLC